MRLDLIVLGILDLAYSYGSEFFYRRDGMLTVSTFSIWCIHYFMAFSGAIVSFLLQRLLSSESSSSTFFIIIGLCLNAIACKIRYSSFNVLGKHYDRFMAAKDNMGDKKGLGIPDDIIQSGIYSVIRHPGLSAHILHSASHTLFFYSGNFVWGICLILHASIIYFILLQSMIKEESIILSQDKIKNKYRAYMAKVKDRIIPFNFVLGKLQ